MFEATLSLPHCTITVKGGTQKELWRAIAEAQAVFGEDCCGICGSAEIAFVHRVTKEGYEYCEYSCLAPGCGARLSIGQSKTEPGKLFPTRKLLANGQPSWKQGEYDAQHRGWTKWRGDVDQDDEPSQNEQRPASSAPARPTGMVRQPQQPAPSGPRITPEQAKRLFALIRETGTDPAKFCAHYKIPDVDFLHPDKFADALRSLEAKKNAPAGAR